ncbi:copper resistance CopC/CopD family protein [Castellaniella sp.]|uniref:copper resistance CopC/CopD family protein n=1 Tax=Castellaniella sp. TaxID=1955812 RepID=UPI003C71C930
MDLPMMGATRRVHALCFRGFASLLWVLAALAWGPRAFAHAALVSSSPAQGAVLSTAPHEARLTFDEPVSALVFKIIEPDGTARDVRKIQPVADGLMLSLPALSERGTYALSWRVVSADGHPVGGTLTFAVGEPGAGPTQVHAAHFARDFWVWLGSAAWYVMLISGVGLALCAARGAASPRRRALGLSWLAAAGAVVVVNVGLLGIDALDLPLAGLLRAQAWQTAAATSFGLSAALALLALACAAASWMTAPVRFRVGLALLSAALLGVALAASGHASTAPPVWLARPAVWLHVVAVTLWVGSLAPLYVMLRSPAGSGTLLRWFSRVIPAALLALLVSGAALIYLQFDTPSSLWRTAYGRVLIGKLLLVAVLLALGAYNRYRLTGAVLAGELAARRSLRRVVCAEIVVGLAILAVVALWRFTPPPRALEAAARAAVPAAVSEHIHGSQAMVDLSYLPAPRGGAASLSLYLSTPGFENLRAQAVEVVFSDTDAGIEPIAYPARQAEDGSWKVSGIQLPQRDHWDVRIDILVSDFKRVSVRTTLRLSGGGGDLVSSSATDNPRKSP